MALKLALESVSARQPCPVTLPRCALRAVAVDLVVAQDLALILVLCTEYAVQRMACMTLPQYYVVHPVFCCCVFLAGFLSLSGLSLSGPSSLSPRSHFHNSRCDRFQMWSHGVATPPLPPAVFQTH